MPAHRIPTVIDVCQTDDDVVHLRFYTVPKRLDFSIALTPAEASDLASRLTRIVKAHAAAKAAS